MKYLLIICLGISATAFANGTWERTKKQVNETAEGVDRVTRETIQKGKTKMKQKQEENKEEKEMKERKEYLRLKEKYGDKV